MPQFSIVINTFNQEKFICDAVDSALSQRYSNKEVIVVDDASSDWTAKVLERYGDKINLIKLEINQGANRARNIGASAATGEFLVPLDGDDLLLPWALDIYERILEMKKPKIILCKLLFFQGEIPKPKFNDFGEEVKIVEYENLIKKDRGYRGSVSAIVVQRKVFNDVNGWTNEIWPSEIDDLQMKLSYSGKTIHILTHPTAAYRVHPNQTMRQVHRFIDTMHMVIRKEKQGEYPGGPKFQYERYAYIGGPVCFWFTRALNAKLYWRALKLLLSGWLMAFARIVSKFVIMIKGKKPVSII